MVEKYSYGICIDDNIRNAFPAYDSSANGKVSSENREPFSEEAEGLTSCKEHWHCMHIRCDAVMELVPTKAHASILKTCTVLQLNRVMLQDGMDQMMHVVSLRTIIWLRKCQVSSDYNECAPPH